MCVANYRVKKDTLRGRWGGVGEGLAKELHLFKREYGDGFFFDVETGICSVNINESLVNTCLY